jgi:hypothetical protein
MREREWNGRVKRQRGMEGGIEDGKATIFLIINYHGKTYLKREILKS